MRSRIRPTVLWRSFCYLENNPAEPPSGARPAPRSKKGHALRHAPTNELTAESSYLEDFPRSEEEFPLLEFTLF